MEVNGYSSNNAEWDISVDGDALEQGYYESIIKNNLPNYANIWELFIGNNGNNEMVSFPDNDKFTNDKREKFSMIHYTILESFVCNKLILEEIQNKQILQINDWIKFKNLIINFFAHIGRIRAMIREISHLFDDKYFDKKNKYNVLVDKRNIILHNKTFPFQFRNNTVIIPHIGEGNKEWNRKKHWKDSMSLDKEDTYNYLNNIQIEALSLSDKFLENIYEELQKYMNENNLKIEPPIRPNKVINVGTDGISGASSDNQDENIDISSNSGKFSSSGPGQG